MTCKMCCTFSALRGMRHLLCMNTLLFFVNINLFVGKLEEEAHRGFVANPALLFGNREGRNEQLGRTGQHLMVSHIDLREDHVIVQVALWWQTPRLARFQ